MPLLLLPLGLMVLLALWLVLFPWSLWQRYRRGKATRRVWPWQVRLNLGLLGVAIAVFLLISAVLQHWWPHQLSQAALGLGAGIALGMLGIATSRFEWREAGLFHTPNPWLVLLLTLLIAGRILLGLVQVIQQGMAWSRDQVLAGDLHAGLTGLAGLLLGYGLAGSWGLHRRLRRLRR
nr:DUF1453 domain-containing protein [Pseudoxanthomonas sp.]